MPLRPGFAVGFVLVAGVALNSCASPRNGTAPRAQECPGFQITVAEINVPPAGDTFPLGPGSEIEFAPGAVSVDTRFTVRALTVDGKKVAGVRLEPATPTFPEPVRLRLSYAGCPAIEQKENESLYIGVIGADGSVTPIGGAKSKQRKFVETYVPHFSDFAIAL